MGFMVNVPPPKDIWSEHNRGVESVSTGLGQLFGQFIAKRKQKKEEIAAREQAEKAYTTESKYEGMQLSNPPLDANEGRFPNLTSVLEPQKVEKTQINKPDLPQNMGKGFYDTLTAAKTKEKLFPEQPEEYTLTAGAGRFRGKEMTASMPTSSENFTLSPGEKRFQGSTEIAAVPKPSEAPKTREVVDKDELLTQEWTPDGTWRDVARGPRHKPGQTNVTVNTAGKKFWDTLGEKSSDVLFEQRKAAQDASSGLRTISEAKNSLKSGIYSGPAANVKLSFDKWLQETGINIGGQTAANTEAFAAATGKLVGKIIKEFGSGTGLSDADREYAEKIAGGKITMTQESLHKILDISERMFRVQINEYQKNLDRVKKAPEYQDIPMTLDIEAPGEDTKQKIKSKYGLE